MLCRNHVDVSEGIRRCARCGAPFCSNCLVDISGKPYCATCKTEQILDVRSGVERGVLDLASIGRRFGASFVDGLLMWIPIAVMIAVVGFASATSARVNGVWNFWFLVPTLVAVSYQALMLAARATLFASL